MRIEAEQMRPDKIIVKNQKEDLFYARINDDGSIFLEFSKAVAIELSSSNCFTIRIRQ